MSENWVKVEKSMKLNEQGQMVFRHEGKQILLIKKSGDIFAVNNRCPHEGYPLSEGSLSDDCKLTCNWHNWKFDLMSGETLVGGDALRHYPVRRDDNGLWIDIQDASKDQIRQKALDNIQDSFDRYEYDRMARELGRFKQAGGDYRDAVADCIVRNFDRFEYGMGHAFAAAVDWLVFANELETEGKEDEALTAVLEIISHVGWDVRREKHYKYSEAVETYNKDAFTDAIEQEDEEKAVALIRGAFSAGMTYQDIEPALFSAAIAHYNDFGHSVIYVYKAGQLLEEIGPSATLPLVLSLVRHLIYTSREDLIPEFRQYAIALSNWDGLGKEEITARDLRGLSVNKALDRILKSSAHVDASCEAIHQTLGWNMLQFDLPMDIDTSNVIKDNVNWLDFTHGLTFANAVRALCSKYPKHWPQALLQLACFAGRNVGFIDAEQDNSDWQVEDQDQFLKSHFNSLIDHGVPEPIVSCHLMKVLAAVKEDVEQVIEEETRMMLIASTNRFLNSPLKRKHGLRTAKQARHFVSQEG